MIVRLLTDKIKFEKGRPKPEYTHRLLMMLDEFSEPWQAGDAAGIFGLRGWLRHKVLHHRAGYKPAPVP